MKYFRKSEFSCPCCGSNRIDNDLLEKLDKARELAGTPFVINSGYRCESHNKAVGGKPESSHLKGLAADIRCTTSGDRHKIIKGLLDAGFTRIGVGRTFIHADIDGSLPEGMVWLYA